MSTATFPTAEKVVYYRIGDVLYTKIKQREAIERADAIRAVLGDAIGWFVPVMARDVGKTQPTAGEPSK